LHVNDKCIGQSVLFESDKDCDTSYEDRGGKYQDRRT